jgi:hypothetical protein
MLQQRNAELQDELTQVRCKGGISQASTARITVVELIRPSSPHHPFPHHPSPSSPRPLPPNSALCSNSSCQTVLDSRYSAAMLKKRSGLCMRRAHMQMMAWKGQNRRLTRVCRRLRPEPLQHRGVVVTLLMMLKMVQWRCFRWRCLVFSNSRVLLPPPPPPHSNRRDCTQATSKEVPPSPRARHHALKPIFRMQVERWAQILKARTPSKASGGGMCVILL